ncbi:MAG: carboxypeptidase regulatory-like domain-containing protein [Gemmatimonadetes bacterium]|nr:carboxypeptidase regulatory-like domain-containing protein [Gemmatimonadota bacterium]
MTLWMAVGLGLVVTPASTSAQTFEGRVLEDESEAPVATALVTLLDAEGAQQAVSIADEGGLYRVRAPEPGIYRLRAERIGFETFETPLLEAGVADRTYAVDLVVRSDPLELPGFTVETDRLSDEAADRAVQLILGLSPQSLRFRPVGHEAIQGHVDRAHNLVDLLRWEAKAGLVITTNHQGPCIAVRARGCLPVYLNGLRLRRDFVESVPLEMIYRVVVVTSTDGSIVYPSGAVLLFTEVWLG